MLYSFLNQLFIIFNLIFLYGFLYLTPVFNYFYNNTTKMRHIWYSTFLIKMNNTSKRIGFYNKIHLIKPNLVMKKEMNLLLMNHNTIFDNFILSKILVKNSFIWNDLRTVSVISNRQVQNTTLSLHDCLLVSKDIKNDIEALDKIESKWKESKDCIQLILFPEGIIYDDNTITEQDNKHVKFIQRILKEKYKNVLIPKIGIYNMLLSKFQNNIKNIYDISAVYLLGNKRIYGELNILKNMSNKDFKVLVDINKFNINDVKKDNYWLFKRWKEKDNWIDSKLNPE
jgi:hypothetical protein